MTLGVLRTCGGVYMLCKTVDVILGVLCSEMSGRNHVSMCACSLVIPVEL